MKRHARLCGALLMLAAAAPLTAGAQERGRTDGPEGSEYGKGGYDDPGGRGVSLQFDWGAAVNTEEPPRGAPEGPPLFVGATLSLWGDDWYQLDASAAYVFDGGRFVGMVGPRFRTWGWPLVFTAGLKAGAIVIPEEGLRFGISPQVGAEFMLGDNDHIIMGLNYSPDIPLGGDEGATHRIGMSVGYKF